MNCPGHCWVYVWRNGVQILTCLNCPETKGA